MKQPVTGNFKDATSSGSRLNSSSALETQLKNQRHTYRSDPCPDVWVRLGRLNRLAGVLDKYQEDIVSAATVDFGHRARMETRFGEVLATGVAIDHVRSHLNKWTRRRKVPTPLHMKPGHSYLVPRPLGVVGIISPWNYPFYLALSPLVPALAAGNRLMLKPSELTPHFSKLLATMMIEAFDPDEVAVFTGGREVGEAFAEQPFDHLLFTGSTAIGRRVALAAAANLTPVTLELGGKSPAIIDADVDLDRASRSIMFGKAFNAGQTCVAPDYILAPRALLSASVAALTQAAASLYPQMTDTADYSAIISAGHFERLSALLAEARASGVELVELGEADQMKLSRKIPITLVINAPRHLQLMQEEIFGPILPIVVYDDVDDAIAYVNAGDRPLAFYWFGRNAAVRDRGLARTVSGGVTISDTNWHVVQENLPFGGVGASGQRAHHGEARFATFSHLKPVFDQSRFANTRMRQPPFTPRTEKILKLIQRFL